MSSERQAELLAQYSGVRLNDPFKEQKLIVVGDRQMAVFNDVEEKEKLLLYPHSIGWKNHVSIAGRA